MHVTDRAVGMLMTWCPDLILPTLVFLLWLLMQWTHAAWPTHRSTGMLQIGTKITCKSIG
eukprot:6423429-Amphidinium_carterae.1